MTRLVWLTDPHLNFVNPPQLDSLLARVQAAEPDAVAISGDIGESHDVVDYLAQLDDRLQRPVYFVLGNHDFYFGSIARVRAAVAQLCRQRPRLVYLNNCGPRPLTTGVGLVGHDGWADGRIGDYERSLVMMNDYKLIEELAGVGKQQRWPLLMNLGDEAAGHIRRILPEALAKFNHVYLVTHVPPLREACWHEGQISDDEWAPHFTCQAMGDAILEIMRGHPQQQLTVLCGHTHSSGQTQPLPNVTILTGGAKYGKPDITGTFDVS